METILYTVVYSYRRLGMQHWLEYNIVLLQILWVNLLIKFELMAWRFNKSNKTVSLGSFYRSSGASYSCMIIWSIQQLVYVRQLSKPPIKRVIACIYICLYFHQLLMSIWNTDITLNHMQLYTHIYASSTQQYIMTTVTDNMDSIQIQLTGSPRERHAKTHASPPTGIPQPGLRLVGSCAASQSEDRPENPRQPTQIGIAPRNYSPDYIYRSQLLNIYVHLVSLFIH